ncbi:MAG: iron ABC transporter permease [Cyanophyceae cyanobacterium]
MIFQKKYPVPQRKGIRPWSPGLALWDWLVLAIAGPVALPLGAVALSAWVGSLDVWQHLGETVLGRYVFNSCVLTAGVLAGTALMGTGTAWLTVACRFPGRRWFEWALLLPMAIPAYLLAYVYTDVLDFYGPVQQTLRSLTGWGFGDYWFPPVRSLPGAIAMLALVLYPYVYLLCRVAFLEQAAATLEASRTLGRSPWQSFWQVALPLTRPALTAALALVAMETLSDFGTVQYFGVDTFTTGIYRTWFGMGDRAASSQLALVLLGGVAALMLLERRSRGRAQYYSRPSFQEPTGYDLTGLRAAAAAIACALPIALGFLVPVVFLVNLAIQEPQTLTDERFWSFANHSAILSTVAAAIAVVLALLLAYGVRLRGNWRVRLGRQIASLGYAIPGSVVAVGVSVALGALDQLLSRLGLITDGLLLSGTVAALVFAYLVRFLAVAIGTVVSSLDKISPSLDDAARSLGKTPLATLFQVHMPIAGGGLLTAALLVFVDVMKELPATLIMRPFNFDTLAVRVYSLASDERLAEAAGPALAIAVVGLGPVILLSWQIARSRRQRHPIP